MHYDIEKGEAVKEPIGRITIERLHKDLGKLIEEGYGDMPILINRQPLDDEDIGYNFLKGTNLYYMNIHKRSNDEVTVQSAANEIRKLITIFNERLDDICVDLSYAANGLKKDSRPDEISRRIE